MIDLVGTDFEFVRFDANSTLNFGPMDKRAAPGMIGETIGEGHYGLVLIGDANVRTAPGVLYPRTAFLTTVIYAFRLRTVTPAPAAVITSV